LLISNFRNSTSLGTHNNNKNNNKVADRDRDRERARAAAREAAGKVAATSSMDSTRSFWRTLSILRTSWRGSYRAEMIGGEESSSLRMSFGFWAHKAKKKNESAKRDDDGKETTMASRKPSARSGSDTTLVTHDALMCTTHVAVASPASTASTSPSLGTSSSVPREVSSTR
jgi:hypothetical protein